MARSRIRTPGLCLLGVSLMLAACGSPKAASGTGSTTRASTIASTTTVAPTTVPPSSSTTTTTAATSTTVLPSGSVPPPVMLSSASSVPDVSPSQVAGGLAQIPWSDVGPGWTLVLYDSSTAPAVMGAPKRPMKAGIVALFLVSPAGTRYVVDHWAASLKIHYELVSWSGSARLALVEASWLTTQGGGRLMMIDLSSGLATTLAVPHGDLVYGFASPESSQLFVAAGDSLQLETTSGASVADLGSFHGLEGVFPGPHGSVVVTTATAMYFEAPSAPPVRLAPSFHFCSPLHFWNASSVLAFCEKRAGTGNRLYLVPLDGGTATALTPAVSKVVGAKGSPWQGIVAEDLDAWQLPSGLYLQVAGACGTVFIGRQLASGVQYVGIPGVSSGSSTAVVTAVGPQLEVNVVVNGCNPPPDLIWFNPATRAVTAVLSAPGGTAGFSFVPYPTLQDMAYFDPVS